MHNGPVKRATVQFISIARFCNAKWTHPDTCPYQRLWRLPNARTNQTKRGSIASCLTVTIPKQTKAMQMHLRTHTHAPKSCDIFQSRRPPEQQCVSSRRFLRPNLHIKMPYLLTDTPSPTATGGARSQAHNKTHKKKKTRAHLTSVWQTSHLSPHLL